MAGCATGSGGKGGGKAAGKDKMGKDMKGDPSKDAKGKKPFPFAKKSGKK